MNVGLIICLTLLTTISGEEIPYKIPYNYYDIWMGVGQNSSGQLFFDTDLYSRRIFIWKPYNASIAPSLFFEEYPKIIQGDISTTPSGNLEGTVPEDIHVNPPPAFKKAEEKLSSKHHSGIHPTNAPTAAALKISPPGKNTSCNDTPVAVGMNVLHHSLKLAELMITLSQQRTIPNLMAPSPRNEMLNSTSPSNDSIVYAKDEVELAKESSRLYHIRREKLRIKRQISPDAATELNLSDAQLNNMQAQVNRRFLMGYDCSNPQEMKPISSFIRDPCEPSESNEQDKYEISDTTEYQLVEYETRREFEGT